MHTSYVGFPGQGEIPSPECLMSCDFIESSHPCQEGEQARPGSLAPPANPVWSRGLSLISKALNRILFAVAFGAVLLGQAENWQDASKQEAVSPPPSVEYAAAPAAAQSLAPGQSEFLELSAYLSQRYRVAPDSTGQWVSAAHDAASGLGLDPLLILAVIAVESSFDPMAESSAGAMGLMQVVPRYHHDALEEHGGWGALLDPGTNIAVGARILKRYIHAAGSLEAGLQSYNGSRPDASRKYAKKVIAERDRLRAVADRPGYCSSSL